MNTSKLKSFAKDARLNLIDQVSSKLYQVLKDESPERRELPQVVAKLEAELKSKGEQTLIDQVAYTWFNRFCALRFMDVNGYNRIAVISPIEGQVQPEILAEAKAGYLDESVVKSTPTRERIAGLLNGSITSRDGQSEAYRLLIVAACNSYFQSMPFLFEQIQDYTELLMPEDLLSDNSILVDTRDAMTPENCENVEVIGWLYQFYISDKKDDVFAALKKGKKITAENIPAATQLFTPHWIVRYLVENSLGRLWMLNHPDSALIEQMDYYIKPEEPESDFLRIEKPEDIKLSDPACGSGHMLTYAFDLMYAIYEEQGYPKNDIPQLILKHNLYGIEIDPRAGALAAFALTMKAREKYRRFLSSGKAVQPNICVLENIHIQPEELSAYMDKVGLDLFSTGLQEVVSQWGEADNFGSLIRPAIDSTFSVLQQLKTKEVDGDLLLAETHQKVLRALKQTEYLTPRYHIVVANPPYMGGGSMNSSLKEVISTEFENAKQDLYAVFIIRNIELCVKQGYLGMITMQGWMFLASFKKFRESLLSNESLVSVLHLGARAFDTIGGEVVSTTSFVLKHAQNHKQKCQFLNLVNGQSELEKQQIFLDVRESPTVVAIQSLFDVPSVPIAYWLPEKTRSCFQRPALGELLESEGAVKTGNNEKYLRMIWEVSYKTISQSGKWRKHPKGGDYRKWYGNLEWVIDWSSSARLHYRKDHIARIPIESVWGKSGISWSAVASGGVAFRFLDEDEIANNAALFIFPKQADTLFFILGLLNSVTTPTFLKVVSPTVNVLVGDVLSIPQSSITSNATVSENSLNILEISKKDWDSREVSIDFHNPEILQLNESFCLAGSYDALQKSWKEKVKLVNYLESQNDQIFLKDYGLAIKSEASSTFDQVTLNCNPTFRYGSGKTNTELDALILADTMREFISYGVGCMFGRYSLDKPSLILGDQGDIVDKFYKKIPDPTFKPDQENVIPLLDGDWFTDDISERFKKFLKVTFGTENFDDNLIFLENALYPDNLTSNKRKTIRDYFLKDFYNHHVKLYKKRPIYWLFSSPKGTFNALIYMHRYRPDTVSVVLNSYLRELQTKLQAKKENLEQVGISATASPKEKTQALKEISKLNTMLTELKDYERDVLYPLATQNIEIDLDDGVKVNYPKFGKALKKVTGLS